MAQASSAEKDIAKLLAKTTALQRDAADPQASVWVSANAGTGKTHVLTSRTLRLLLAGTPPEKILCLTYTKAAAAEMSTRVFDRLADWVTETDEKLAADLASLLGRAASDEESRLARTLFTKAIETPGGLKVQTIHAFCERLLQRFPLEAGVPPGFAILDDDLGAKLRREAIDDVLRSATHDPDTPLGRALTTAIAHAADDRFDEVLREAISERTWLASAAADIGDGAHDDFKAFLHATFGIAEGRAGNEVARAQAGVLADAQIERAAVVLAEGKKSDQELAAHFSAAAKASMPASRVDALSRAFLTKDGSARADSRFITKDVRAAEPGLSDALVNARDTFAALAREAKALDVIDATLALVTLGSAVQQRYADAKAQRAALDFDDLILRTGSLLSNTSSADWVLYKLDGGLDHILVDESQDTSREQWAVVEALAREFFSGEGARETARTMFAVGDEKQSIYSFQGAAPEMFAEMGAKFASLAQDAGNLWRSVPLTLSFRTVAPILEAVDEVLSDPDRTPGLHTGEAHIQHEAKRIGSAGLVEIWPTEVPEERAQADIFDPNSETPGAPPAIRLAQRIAGTIKHWLENGERLVAEDRPIRAGDVLILVRKRNPLAGPMVAALKAASIPVAGADRIDLNEQIAVKDLVALGQFLTLPEDDLSLACVLKSPLIGFDDDDLFRLCAFEEDGEWRSRSGSLWRSLLASREVDQRFEAAVAQLVAWRKRADFQPPYEFFAQLLDADGMRAKLLARLGIEAADAIDSFLELSINYDEKFPPSLSGFLTWLGSGKREIKRDMEQGADAVRVMTVHGSKGLEAPIVFLADTCTGSGAGGNTRALVELTTSFGESPAHAWKIKGAGKLEALADARSSLGDRETEERNRLLYVAMTRARDRLYVGGFEGAKGRDRNCWYDLICDGLADRLTDATDHAGRDVQRYECQQTADHEKPKEAGAGQAPSVELPAWARTPAPAVPSLTIPLAPSQLAPYEADNEGEPVARVRDDEDGLPQKEPSAPSPKLSADERRFLRGTLTHQLLEHLPAIAPEHRAQAGETYLAARGAVLPAGRRASILKETLAILDHPDFAHLFGPDSRAEVSIAAEIPRPDGDGPALKLSGQIDRLAVVGDDVMIIDYKTNRPPPLKAESIAEAYVLQLAAYRLAINEIYPGKNVRAAILWTMGPRLVEVPSGQLENVTAKLWKCGATSLDARCGTT